MNTARKSPTLQRIATALALALAAGTAPALQLSLPGEAIEDHEPGRWLAATLDEQGLVLAPVDGTRRSDWTVLLQETATDPDTHRTRTEFTEKKPAALALPEGALLALQSEGASAGRHANALEAPVLLREGWRRRVVLQGEHWLLEAEARRGADGRLLAGSMSLMATKLGEMQRTELLPPAVGMAFQRQELLWVGRTAGQGLPDLLLRRTWITGEVDYVTVMAGERAVATLDADHPWQKFSSGIEEAASTARHAQARPLVGGRFGMAAFKLGEEEWNAALARQAQAATSATLFDRQLRLDDEALRFTADYLPRWEGGESAGNSTAPGFAWGGPAVLKVHFRGTTQALMQTGMQDGSPMRVQVGRLGGEPAIEVQYQPHYNNSFVQRWVWDANERRFVRLLKQQDQGC